MAHAKRILINLSQIFGSQKLILIAHARFKFLEELINVVLGHQIRICIFRMIRQCLDQLVRIIFPRSTFIADGNNAIWRLDREVKFFTQRPRAIVVIIFR